VAGAANGDHTACTRYAAHRARLAIDLRAVLLASGQRQLGAALRAGDERALTPSGRQASLSSTLAETTELGTLPAQGQDRSSVILLLDFVNAGLVAGSRYSAT